MAASIAQTDLPSKQSIKCETATVKFWVRFREQRCIQEKELFLLAITVLACGRNSKDTSITREKCATVEHPYKLQQTPFKGKCA